MTKAELVRYLEQDRQHCIERKEEWSQSTRSGAFGVESFYMGKVEGLEYALSLIARMED